MSPLLELRARPDERKLQEEAGVSVKEPPSFKVQQGGEWLGCAAC